MREAIRTPLSAAAAHSTASTPARQSDAPPINHVAGHSNVPPSLSPSIGRHFPGGKPGQETRAVNTGLDPASSSSMVSVDTGNPSQLLPPPRSHDEARSFSTSAVDRSSRGATPGSQDDTALGLIVKSAGRTTIESSKISNSANETTAIIADQGIDGRGASLPPALTPPRLVLPWDEELGDSAVGSGKRARVGVADRARDSGTMKRGGGGCLSARSHARSSIGGIEGGLATYPGQRPLSAPRVGNNKVYARTSLTPSSAAGRSYSIVDGSTKGTGLNGASLAGTLLAYATGPDGKLDIFGAARDGQVRKICSLERACADGDVANKANGTNEKRVSGV